MSIEIEYVFFYSDVMNTDRTIFINTCVFGVPKLPMVGEYIRQYPGRVGFEILPMFDLPEFEPVFETVLSEFKTCPISFHGPVYGAEHSAPRGSAEYEETMWHVRKTAAYAKLLCSSHFTMHLNNCIVEEGRKQTMLQNALENYKELADIFGAFGCRIFLENTGTKANKNMLLDQQEFTELCISKGFEVLIDIGHAHANGWDLPGLIRSLKGQIRAYHLHNNDGVRDQHNRLHEGTLDINSLMEVISLETPEAEWIIEYIRQEQEGNGLKQDIKELMEKRPLSAG